MGYIFGCFLIEIGVALAVFFLFPRWVCVGLAGLLLFLGIGVPALAWGYAAMFVKGDSSGFGMLGTLCVVLFAPPGLMLSVLSVFKRD